MQKQTTLKTPTSQQVQTVIDNFKKVLPIANGHSWMLDMGEGRVWTKVECDEKNICGTPMCHAGWYATAEMDRIKKQYANDPNWYPTYDEGAEAMAKDLGFEDEYELQKWANDNEIIWGNDTGYEMFNSKFAFATTKRHRGAESLQDIVDHWEEVRDRIIALENTSHID